MSNFTTTYIGKYAVSLSNHNIYRKINIKKIFKNTPVPRFNQEHTEKLLNSSLASLTYLSQGSSTNKVLHAGLPDYADKVTDYADEPVRLIGVGPKVHDSIYR